MKFIVALLALIAVTSAVASTLDDPQYEFLFTKWMDEHTRVYATPDEFQYRFQVWRNNMEQIINHKVNYPDATHTVAMNEFGDMTNEEFTAKYNGYRPRQRSNLFSPTKFDTTNLPSSVDWPAKGVVTPVKNQGQCGSCWTFSTTGSIESAHAIKTGNLISLSEQELVDCSKNGGDAGCNGGEMDNAFQWVIQHGGLCTESAYPYEGSNGSCQDTSCSAAVTISSYKDVEHNNNDQMMAAVAQQPVSIAVDASGFNWQFYYGGVMTGSCGTQLDHGVLAAGYGSENGQDYWLVKNSWGTSWGESGYLKLARGSGTGSAGMCGILMDPSYPIA